MRVKVGDRIATIPGGHVAEVTRVDGPHWVVVRFEDSGLETGFKGIDSDYWEKVGWTIPLTKHSGRHRAGKRSAPGRKAKRHAGKRRTLTKMRHVRFTKRRGHAVRSAAGGLSKKQRLLAGEQVVVTDTELDRLEADADIGTYLASVPNPRQVGTKDRWLAYLK